MSEDWRALGAEAARFLSEGRWADAVEAFQAVVALEPGHADSWFNLGYAQRHARHYEDALESYAKAIGLGVRSPEEARLNRAVILSEHLHRVEEARSELNAAIKENGRLTAAWLNLGNLEEDLGNGAAAREAYRGALRASPTNGRALARLAGLETHGGDARSAVAALEKAARIVRPDSEDAAELSFALGTALDSAGEYRQAFAAFARGNAIAARLRPPEARYDRRRHEELVGALIQTFGKPPAPSGEQAPVVFICGMFRSGSTLMEQLLGRHRDISAGGELEFIPAMVAEQLQPYPAALSSFPVERARALRDQYLADVRSLFPAASRVTDKRPDNFLHIGLIKTLFPGARIVHTVRNPLDTILSAYALYFAQEVSYSEQLDDLVHFFTQYRRLMAHWQSIYGADIFDANYDQLVADPRSVLEPLLVFLGLDWDGACLDHLADSAAVRTASVWQVRKPLHQKSSGRWRNYAPELAPVRDEFLALGLLSPDEA